MNMERWEYRTLSITYDRRKRKDWVAEYQGQAPIIGFQAVLERYGMAGWELVSLNLERWRAVPGLGEYSIEPSAYRVTFRRPLRAEA
jgi:hypothetical protein